MSELPRPPEVIDTQRLSLRRPTLSDAQSIFRSYATDPAVTRFLLWQPHSDLNVTRLFIAQCERSWVERSAYRWVVETRQEGELLGMVSAHVSGHAVELGSVLARGAWGHGYIAEALRPIADWALAQEQVFRVWAVCDVDDERSTRVLAKLGMQREGYLRKWVVHPNLSPVPRDCWCYACVKSSGLSLEPGAGAATPQTPD